MIVTSGWQKKIVNEKYYKVFFEKWNNLILKLLKGKNGDV